MASLIFLISLAVNLVRGPESVFSPIFSNLLQIYILIFTKNIFLFTKVRIVLLYQLTTNTNFMTQLQNDYRNEIVELTNNINYCNNAICARTTANWEKKEYHAVKIESMKRKITLIKIYVNFFAICMTDVFNNLLTGIIKATLCERTPRFKPNRRRLLRSSR